ncbi:MAG: hypothetical protein ACRD0J_02440 [Acidimicrobiales bacterium]
MDFQTDRCVSLGPDWPGLPTRARRRAWVAGDNTEPVCAICAEPWSLRAGDLHRRSYARLGHEADADLVPLCRDPCHRVLHRVLESNPAWLRGGRARASDVIVARLRARRGQRGG